MPKTINRPRDDVDAEQMQQGQATATEENAGAQMDDAVVSDDSSEQQLPV